MSSIEGRWDVEGRRVRMTRDEVTDGYADVMQIQVLRGRWFQPADDAANFIPVVIDSNLAADMYPGEDPLGRKFDERDTAELRVVGVIAPFRKDGEITRRDTNMVFTRVSVNKPDVRVPYNLVVRLRPGTPAGFEEALSRRLHQVVPEVSFRIRHMDRMREFSLRAVFAPIIIGGVVAAFLIAMVMLGLSGVLWQNVTRRTRELGLRRALGATRESVRRQILGEVAMLVTLAVVLGVVIVAQLPVLGIFTLVTPAAFAVGLGGSLAMIYGIALLCGTYPGWLASRIQPAQALHYE
jgi:putative ABC transport system permease protein